MRQVAQRAEALGFRDLWVTENTLDHVFCFDALTILTYAAAVTMTVRVGVAVIVLPVHSPIEVAHRVATLDYVSHGRAILGVGLGREHHYAEFQVPTEHRVRRFREGVEVRRAATIADGWMGSGGSSTATFARSVPILGRPRHAGAGAGATGAARRRRREPSVAEPRQPLRRAAGDARRGRQARLTRRAPAYGAIVGSLFALAVSMISSAWLCSHGSLGPVAGPAHRDGWSRASSYGALHR